MVMVFTGLMVLNQRSSTTTTRSTRSWWRPCLTTCSRWPTWTYLRLTTWQRYLQLSPFLSVTLANGSGNVVDFLLSQTSDVITAALHFVEWQARISTLFMLMVSQLLCWRTDKQTSHLFIQMWCTMLAKLLLLLLVTLIWRRELFPFLLVVFKMLNIKFY